MFKRVWQVVETIFFTSKITFFVETCKNFEFFIFFRILLVQVEENYTKNNDLQYFLFQIKIANAILHTDEVLQRRNAYEIPYNSAYNALLHVTHFFSNFKYIRKYLQNCVWLSYLFPFQKRFAKTGEFRPSKTGPCFNSS